MPCAPLLMLGGPGSTDCDGVSFLVHRGWNSRDVSMCDCVTQCVRFSIMDPEANAWAIEG